MAVGDLSERIPIEVGSVVLPPGMLIHPQVAGVMHAPVMWATTDLIPEPGNLWFALSESSATSGFTPVVLDGLHNRHDRPWDSGELDPRSGQTPNDVDEGIVFLQRWNMNVPAALLPAAERPPPLWLHGGEFPSLPELKEDDEERDFFLEMVAPWGVRFPGLALAERTAGDTAAFRKAINDTASGRIGLVETSRPADILPTIGWVGAINHFISETGAATLSVMMRSWEDRFGAKLFRLGFDTMMFAVERPPSTEESAMAVAAEHFAFAGIDGFQAYTDTPVESIQTLATVLLHNPIWQFWFD